jgi:hypothetical protein
MSGKPIPPEALPPAQSPDNVFDLPEILAIRPDSCQAPCDFSPVYRSLGHVLQPNALADQLGNRSAPLAAQCGESPGHFFIQIKLRSPHGILKGDV